MNNLILNNTQLLQSIMTTVVNMPTNHEELFISSLLETYSNSNISNIGPQAFYKKRILTSVNFPAVQNIDEQAFCQCRNLVNATIPNCINIGNNAFEGCRKLSACSFPNCVSIGEYAFYSCSSIAAIDFPNCLTIRSNAFGYCTSLTTINLPECSDLGSGAFQGCYNLVSVNLPKGKYLNDYTFRYCSNLTEINLPECTQFGSDIFYGCKKLSSVSIPKITWIASGAFRGCTSLASIVLPSAMTLSYYAFYDCSNLGYASFGRIRNGLSSYTFGYCYKLSQLLIRPSSIVTLSNSNVFYSTPFRGMSTYFSGTPQIYVPASLLTTFKTATNWAYFSNYFLPIEEYIKTIKSNIITFTIDGNEYITESGLTWEPWISHETCTYAAYVNSSTKQVRPMGQTAKCLYKDGIVVKPDDVIIENGAYISNAIP